MESTYTVKVNGKAVISEIASGIHCVFGVDRFGTPVRDICCDDEQGAKDTFQRQARCLATGKLPPEIVEVCRYDSDDLKESTNGALYGY